MINIGAISEALNNKLDIDLGNITSASINKINHYGAPDYTNAIDIASVIGTKYTVPKNGFIFVQARSNGNSDNVTISINNLDYGINKEDAYNNSRRYTFGLFPVKTGDVVKLSYYTDMIYAKFVPCLGE